MITVKGLVDREKGDFYTLTVVADDGGPKVDSTVVSGSWVRAPLNCNPVQIQSPQPLTCSWGEGGPGTILQSDTWAETLVRWGGGSMGHRPHGRWGGNIKPANNLLPLPFSPLHLLSTLPTEGE